MVTSEFFFFFFFFFFLFSQLTAVSHDISPMKSDWLNAPVTYFSQWFQSGSRGTSFARSYKLRLAGNDGGGVFLFSLLYELYLCRSYYTRLTDTKSYEIKLY
jgi:hypothetical protein